MVTLDDASAADLFVFGLVIALRFLVPLGIPKYPLSAILLAFLIDGVDKTIFDQFTDLNLDFYQGYDKALDIYYLAIAYIATLRNWTNQFAFETSRFLYYYRLVGAVAFELTQVRALLLVFPNTFEYFFDFYEIVRIRWDPRRMSKRLLIGAAAFIWIVIKLPQEYIIHVAQVDTTDWIKRNIFGVDPSASWAEAITNRPGVSVLLVVLVVALIGGTWWFVTHRLPPADWKPRFAADPVPAFEVPMQAQGFRLIDAALIEKVVLISLISIIFAQVLPNVQAGNLAIVIGVAVIVAVNAGVSHWLAQRGRDWTSIMQEFVVMAAVNAVLIVTIAVILPSVDGSISSGNTLFFALLLTLIITLFDRYRQVYVHRFPPSG
ncbi:MAG: hypothetical protein AB7U18_22360 [Dehalococcoidia bacterium]